MVVQTLILLENHPYTYREHDLDAAKAAWSTESSLYI